MVCKVCGSSESRFISHDVRRVKDISALKDIFEKQIHIQRLQCRNCNKYYTEPHIKHSVTSELFDTIVGLCRKYSYSEVGKMTHLSDVSIRNIYVDYIQEKIQPISLPQFISITVMKIGLQNIYLIIDIVKRDIVGVSNDLDEYLRVNEIKYVRYVSTDYQLSVLLECIKFGLKTIVSREGYMTRIKDAFKKRFQAQARAMNIRLDKSNSMSLDKLLDVDDTSYDVWRDEFVVIHLSYVDSIRGCVNENTPLAVKNLIRNWYALIVSDSIVERSDDLINHFKKFIEYSKFRTNYHFMDSIYH